MVKTLAEKRGTKTRREFWDIIVEDTRVTVVTAKTAITKVPGRIFHGLDAIASNCSKIALYTLAASLSPFWIFLRWVMCYI